ncbi:MAG: 2-isopropylmalate synthase [Eubacteriaceae bacterium]|nr:2-isopropylmalate synthase [Eubacteriaceae bacterium]
MHIDAVMKNPASFEHVPPESVGNERRILMSEVSGRSTIIQLINEVDPTLTKKSEETTQVMDRIKELEYQGYQFEGAESSVKLLIRKELGKHKPFFTLEDVCPHQQWLKLMWMVSQRLMRRKAMDRLMPSIRR